MPRKPRILNPNVAIPIRPYSQQGLELRDVVRNGGNARSPKDGRGIVTAGDGDKYGPSLVVLTGLLKEYGCKLPVQVYVSGTMGQRCRERLAANGAEVIDAEVPADHRAKWRAVLACPFREVLWLDADCFPLHDPAPWFEWAEFAATGAVQWWGHRQIEMNYLPRWRLPPRRQLVADTCILLVDQARQRAVLETAAWIDERHHAQRYAWSPLPNDYALVAALEAHAQHGVGQPWATVPFRPGWQGEAVALMPDFDGKAIAEHRAPEKLRWFGEQHTRNPKVQHERFMVKLLTGVGPDVEATPLSGGA